MNKKAGIFISLFVLCLPNFANAASFDCAKAKTAIEKQVCSDADLSKLDEQLAASYKGALGKLSTEGQANLRENQKQWLVYLKKVCDPKGQSAGDFSRCLNNKYSERIEDMKTAAVSVGAYTFTRVGHYCYDVDTGNDGTWSGETSVPRIDNPKSDVDKEWNNWLNADLDKDCSRYQPSVSKITVLSQNLIVVSFNPGQGRLAGSYDALLVLTPHIHRISVNELFVFNDAFNDFLIKRCLQQLKDQRHLSESDQDAVVDSIKDSITDANNWFFYDDSVIFQFDSDTLRDLHYIGPYEDYFIYLSWKELHPFLTPDLASDVPSVSFPKWVP